ncbi:putative oxidoreductase C-terminal domain-containing protein [Dysgonomonas termitidis]|uniref:Oxidoreductase C-terminal domain-containing protein n=1 Tax=Dysgonomonas termitidis TaxID=1516126 RepID=A0ABV9L0L2_9BACT
MKRYYIILLIGLLFAACAKDAGKSDKVTLIILAPGHFHAALLQKTDNPQINNDFFVFAPEGDEVNEYLSKIEGFNTRGEEPTHWKKNVYLGNDFLEKMLEQKPGNVVVLAGNNKKKTEYIFRSVESGLNVLADKPMAINVGNFKILEDAFKLAEQKGVLLYDVMTERFEITTILQKEFSMVPDVFGTIQKGSAEEPAIVKESVHHFYKDVAGSVLKRPAWFFDVEQEGNGIVDVTTHLVDLVQWECFPDQIIDRGKVNIYQSRQWPTVLSREQFKKATALDEYPAYLQKDVKGDSLYVLSNGAFNYTINDIHAKISVIWNFQAPDGTGDTHYSIMRGTLCNLIILQGQEQGYKPTLYIEPAKDKEYSELKAALDKYLPALQQKYPGISFKHSDDKSEVIIPDSYKVGHEAHFGQVAANYLKYLEEGKLPEWEVPNMLTKYYITTKALEIAKTTN